MRPTTEEQPSITSALWLVALVLGVVVFVLIAGGV